MNKKLGILFVILFVFVTGCSSNENNGNIKSNSIDERKYDTKDFKYITCTRDTETKDGSTVDINYEIYYNDDDNIEILKSYEKVTSTDNDVLSKYKSAYESIYSVYDGLKYYDHEVDSGDDSVTSITYINYGKIDMDKLMSIEGTDDNVTVTNGKIKLEDWKSFAKKYGTTCNSK